MRMTPLIYVNFPWQIYYHYYESAAMKSNNCTATQKLTSHPHSTKRCMIFSRGVITDAEAFQESKSMSPQPG